MLQQILRDMYVDPEILSQLDEEQKQSLFCKMREEQVRRWKDWNEKLDSLEKPRILPKTKNKKTVTFLKGSDGEPWVWVMGEHETDKTIEAILEEEAREKARKQAEREAEDLRKQMEALSDYITATPKIEDLAPATLGSEEDMDIYCSVDELRERINNKKTPKTINNYSINHYEVNNRLNGKEKSDVFQDFAINTQKVAHKVAIWEKRLKERTYEIYNSLQKKKLEAAREAEEAEKRQELLWQEQERKAKEAEQQIREIARRAREEHRLTSNFVIDPSYGTLHKTGVPPGRQAVLEWYRNHEKSRSAGLDVSGIAQPWFHGLITRAEAEKLLLDQNYGSFLVRLSERLWGYAISYRAKEKCKHYLIEATQKYTFVGTNQLEHGSLDDLISYHKRQPLTGGEKLMEACPRISDVAVEELLGQ